MSAQMCRQDLSDCLMTEELGRLFDEAFAKWQTEASGSNGGRQTPRIAIEEAKPLFVSSYIHKGREIELSCRATLVDISADGLGILLNRAPPLGSTVRFAFENRMKEPNHGVALVAHTTRNGADYRVGLTFGEDACSVDVTSPNLEVKKDHQAARGWRRLLKYLQKLICFAHEGITQREFARKELEKSFDGKKASFVVEAKLTRYSAALFIEGQKVASRSAPLPNRLRSLFSDTATPAVVYLEAGDFAGWATLRPNTVMACTLDLSLERKHQMCRHALQMASELEELLLPITTMKGISTQPAPLP